MNNINITPNELDGMIMRLRQWSQQMVQIRNSMHQYSQQLRQTWRDPNYETYIANIELISRSLLSNAENMEDISKTLLIMKQNLQNMQNQYQSMINRPR